MERDVKLLCFGNMIDHICHQTGRWLKGAFGQLKRNWSRMRASHRHTYQSVIDDYKSKGYIREVPEEEAKPSSELFLPHTSRWFAQRRLQPKSGSYLMARLSKTERVWTVESLPGPKLQSDIVDILVNYVQKGIICLSWWCDSNVPSTNSQASWPATAQIFV